MTLYVRICPHCTTERSLEEDNCAHVMEGKECLFPLFYIHPTAAGARPEAGPQQPPADPQEEAEPGAPDQPKDGPQCPNGHPVETGDALCLECGSRIEAGARPSPEIDGRAIAGWQIVAQLPSPMPETELFLARQDGADEVRLLRYFQSGFEPDPKIYEAVQALGRADVATLIEHGRSAGRAFEVWEHVEGRTLGEVRHELGGDAARIEQIANLLIRTLASFEHRGLRHGNLQPSVIRLRSTDPLAICITDFASARVAEFDVEAVRLRQTSRYVAPEAAAEASTAASDWWSLGIILLEMLTQGRCFEGVHERAFLLHLIARGITLPEDLTPRWRNLLEGLLTRNHENRWRAEQALRWADGEVDIPTKPDAAREVATGPAITFAGQKVRSPAELAFLAAEEANWPEAQSLLESGRLTTWLNEFETAPSGLENIRRVAADQRLKELNPDFPLALSLAALNVDLPLCIRGELVTPAALLANPALGIGWLAREPVAHLRRLRRPSDHWLVLLADRAARVRSRAKESRVTLDGEFKILQLVTSTAALDLRWSRKRALFPESDNPLLASLSDRRTLTDEDLLLLATASTDHFKPAEEILREAEALATRAGLSVFDRQAAAGQMARPRRDLSDELSARLPGFERCGRSEIDGWLDTYRSANRRMPLPRLLVVLAVPVSEWAEPPHQDYIRNVISFLERRVLAGIQRGALVQMRATASVLDLTALNDGLAARLLNAIVTRSDRPAALARDALPPALADKLRALESKARTYHRDTGLDALYLAFPVLTLKVKNEDGEKTRIAPIFLWPVSLRVQAGATGSVTIGFDASRDIQLNPALETILGSDALVRWQDWANEYLRAGFDSYGSVLRALGELAESSSDEKLAPLPQAKSIKTLNKAAMHASAAIFLAEFASQANARDLRQLQQMPLEGTALECLLRLTSPKEAPAVERFSHLDRYTTLEADPSQEEAVYRARHPPGLVVQGPPGTGKSQTIVNIITDCLGRGESVLVVCEKKAALDVVQKRLAAEKLDHRVIRVENTQTDRTAVLQQLRAQVPQILDAREASGAGAQARRRAIASQLDALETALDAYHAALHDSHARLGLSYREVLSLCVREAGHVGEACAPGLRVILGTLDPGQLESVVNECAGLLDVWRGGGAFGSPLGILKPFATDASLAARISHDLTALHDRDRQRLSALEDKSKLGPAFADIVCADEAALAQWLAENESALGQISPGVLARAERWHSYVATEGPFRAAGKTARAALAALIGKLERLAMPGPAALAHGAVREWSAEELTPLSRSVRALRAQGILSFFHLAGGLRRRKARNIVAGRGGPTDRLTILAHAEAAEYELTLRQYGQELQGIAAGLGETIAPEIDRREVLDAARGLARDLDAFRDMVMRVERAPVAGLWPHVERLAAERPSTDHGHPLDPLVTALRRAREVAAANTLTASAAQLLSPYLTAETAQTIGRSIARGKPLSFSWAQVLGALPVLVPYQTFRLRHAQLSATSRAVFPELSPFASRLAKADNAAAHQLMTALMRHEACRAWKDEIESGQPHLQQIQTELERQVRELEALDLQMREVNRRFLGHIERARIKPVQQWSSIWSITGVNAKRLRQVFEKGRALGLLDLRPVWLVNPDVACRMLPLEAGLFDVVVFDEASQMRVASALPALYRGKRAVISGDEKQLPPTSFFGARFESAEDEYEDDAGGAWADAGADEDDGDAEVSPAISARELAASERHIKDCEDLLTLANGVLPPASLDIHYRSEFRELIAFSNAAYYGGKLNVPVRRPRTEILRSKPIEVRRVDGTYRAQTNPEEAAAIIDILAGLWDANASPPTVGVVTFNMKQAELIEARLRQRADEDRKFGRFLDRERARTADGEDVGFFVKNLENVQGDERDWIVFSTTFGRDENGVFKRVFGALNQQGGERRLNVAVTRARRKVMLVTSMPTAEISSFVSQRRPPMLARDYLQAYLRYAELTDEGDFEAAADVLAAFKIFPRGGAPAADQEPDELVRRALETLQSAGFAATPMPLEDAFSVDIAVSHPATGLYALGVEFDSPRHHLLRNARAREVWRPKLIARSGMRVHRIISSGWVQDERRERQRLIEAAREAIAEAEAA